MDGGGVGEDDLERHKRLRVVELLSDRLSLRRLAKQRESGNRKAQRLWDRCGRWGCGTAP